MSSREGQISLTTWPSYQNTILACPGLTESRTTGTWLTDFRKNVNQAQPELAVNVLLIMLCGYLLLLFILAMNIMNGSFVGPFKDLRYMLRRSDLYQESKLVLP